MSLTSSFFMLGLMPFLLLLFYLSRKSKPLRIALLFIVNFFFYFWGGTKAFLVLLFLCLVTFLFCLVLQKYQNNWILWGGVLLLAMPLFIIKYSAFLAGGLGALLKTPLPGFSGDVPLGISFFTFEAISCLADTYSGKIGRRLSLFEIFLYLSFFPTVTSGPIFRENDFHAGLSSVVGMEQLNGGLRLFAIGLCKKILIADHLSPLVQFYFDGTANGASLSCLGLWIGSAAYTLQLYFDFSGYSDMAIGLGKILGFSIPQNFNAPYQANGIQDFWRRWHISLSLWFRDYLYIPLGGSRVNTPLYIRNMLIVWTVTGIWHGADLSFLVWGLGYCALLLLEKYVPLIKKMTKKWYGHLYTLFFVNLLWVPFRAKDLPTAGAYLLGMLGKTGSALILEEKAFRYLPLLAAAVICCMPFGRLKKMVQEKAVCRFAADILLVLLFLLALSGVVSATYTPYIYGNF